MFTEIGTKSKQVILLLEVGQLEMHLNALFREVVLMRKHLCFREKKCRDPNTDQGTQGGRS